MLVYFMSAELVLLLTYGVLLPCTRRCAFFLIFCTRLDIEPLSSAGIELVMTLLVSEISVHLPVYQLRAPRAFIELKGQLKWVCVLSIRLRGSISIEVGGFFKARVKPQVRLPSVESQVVALDGWRRY